MTVTPRITVGDGRLVAHGRTILTGVPDNIALTHASGAGLVDGAFIGATAAAPSSMHVFTFGTLRELRFMCCFRFKLWWMTQRMGTSGRDVPLETQFMLLESRPVGTTTGDETVYVVMLPLLEGHFRAALQGNDRDELEITLESGDKAVQTAQGTYMVYVHAGTNPFDTITQAVKVVERHLQTFHHREKKKLPSFLDWFGWCTWDAFYTDVTAEGVKQGLKSLAEGGTPPRFLIIDDGWQQIGSENKEESNSNAVVQEGAQFASRLTGIKENAKFQKPKKTTDDDDDDDDDGEHEQAQTPGLKLLVESAKREHGVKYVYVWHAMAGYWGGVNPSSEGMERYESAVAYPVQSPGVVGNQPDIVMDSLSVLGLGLVHPRRALRFYDELHSYLASCCGVDGVKVDVQNVIETLGAGHGGRVALTRAYHRALEASVARNFPDNGCISCMCHNTDMLYSAKQTAVVRASDDFYPRDPASHTVHVSSVAYNTLFLGEFMQPDWDMFHVQPAPGGGVPRRGEGDRRLPDLRQRQARKPQLRAAQEASPPRRLRAPRAAPWPPHPRLPLRRPGARRHQPAQDLEREQVHGRGGRVQLPGRRVVPRHQEDPRARRRARDADGVCPRRRRGRHRRPRGARMERRRRRVRLQVGGARPAAPGRHAAGDAQGAGVRGVPRLPRQGGRSRRVVRAHRPAPHVQLRRRGGTVRGPRRRRERRRAQGPRLRPVRRLLLAEAREVHAGRGGGGVQLRRRHGARRAPDPRAGAGVLQMGPGDTGLGGLQRIHHYTRVRSMCVLVFDMEKRVQCMIMKGTRSAIDTPLFVPTVQE